MGSIFNLSFTEEDLKKEMEVNVHQMGRGLKELAREELRNRISKLDLGHVGFRLDRASLIKTSGYKLGVVMDYSILYERGILQFTVKAKIKDEERVDFTLDRKWTVKNLRNNKRTEMSIQSLNSDNTREKIDEFLMVS